MSVASTVEAGDFPEQDVVAHGVVAVYEYGFARRTAVCTCGWAGRRRYLKAAVEQDAWMHSIHDSCDVSVALVMPAVAS